MNSCAAACEVPITVLRGNVDTRLARLRAGEFVAIMLAEAGLKRLDLFDPSFMFPIDERVFVPACTQGIVGLETRSDGGALARALYLASEPETVVRAALERLVLQALGGDCHSVVGIHLSLSSQDAEPFFDSSQGALLIFTASGDGVAGVGTTHQSALRAGDALHKDTRATLGDWTRRALA
ncbi:MAG: hypothetical protein ACO3X1_16565, partial [Burkholderiaceae bacterium]